MSDAVRQEFDHRKRLWARIIDAGGPRGVSPAMLRELGVYGGAQGVWVDKARTGRASDDGGGVTVGLLHTGSSYPDDLSTDAVLYHYPKTNRSPGRDAAEVAATKTAGRLGLPVFVITYPSPNSVTRNVDLAWVQSWDDEAGVFLIPFRDQQPTLFFRGAEDDQPFSQFDETPPTMREVATRQGQPRFKFRVMQRYGSRCAVCGLEGVCN
jgi:hypothetical protein